MIKKIYNRLAIYKDKYSYVRHLRKNFSSNFWFGGSPDHKNLGDSAIVIAELEFIKEFDKNCVGVTWDELYGYYGRAVRKIMMPWDIRCLHGGGNMGDAWFNEELYRRRFIEENRKYKIFIFPQTIYYSKTENGIKQQNASIPFYNHPNITIVAREKTSYDIMKNLYPKAKILLTPDIVLSLPAQNFNLNRTGALLCVRRDKEKKITFENEEKLITALSENGLNVGITDTVIKHKVTKENRKQLVMDKLQELAGSQIVITDRLHGMVFCALTGTPCIVLSNYNHKVKGTYDWISYLPYIKYVDTVEEAISYIPQLLKMENCEYDNTPLQPYFEQLKQALQDVTLRKNNPY